jgi:hypothetical protein
MNNIIYYLGSDVGTMETYLKNAFRYQPQYLKLLNKTVLINIYKEYKNLVEKGFPILSSDKALPNIHFTKSSWITINLLTEKTSLPKPFILVWCESLYKLAKTGKILLTNLDPSKQENNKFIAEIKNAFKSLKITLPLAVTAGVIGSILILKK